MPYRVSAFRLPSKAVNSVLVGIKDGCQPVSSWWSNRCLVVQTILRSETMKIASNLVYTSKEGLEENRKNSNNNNNTFRGCRVEESGGKVPEHL